MSAAAGVEEAVLVGVSDTPRVVLLDLTLGKGENGLDILARWREHGITTPRVLALTGHADEETLERCTAAGCEAVLLKPVPSKELLARVRGAG